MTEARQYWVDAMLKIVAPVLKNLARGELKKFMPTVFHPDRAEYMHLEALGRTLCGMAPWLELEGRTDDVTAFSEGGRVIRVAPLPLYATLKEVHELRRFQALVYPGNRIELRMEEQTGTDRLAAFEKARTALKGYLAAQGVSHVTIILSDDSPRQHPKSGKFKHIVNMENEAAD